MQRSLRRKVQKSKHLSGSTGFRDRRFTRDFFKAAFGVLFFMSALLYFSSRPFVYYYGDNETFAEFLDKQKSSYSNYQKITYVLAYADPSKGLIKFSNSQNPARFRSVSTMRLQECALPFKTGKVAYALKDKAEFNVLFEINSSSIDKERYLFEKLCTHTGLRWRPPSDVRIVKKPEI